MLRAVAILLLTSALPAQEAQPWFFLQLADPQFGMQASDQNFEQETATFEFVIATANRLRPAFVVVCGDLVNKAGDPAQIAEYLRVAGKLDRAIQLYNVPGNHDVGNEPTPETLAAYRSKFGRDYYSFRSRDLAGIVLNSSLIAAPAKAATEAAAQETWLRGELTKLRSGGARYLVVFQHHPWFLKDPAEPDQYFNIPLPQRRRYLDLLRAAGVSHVFAGHYHRNSFGRDDTLEMVTTGPVGKPLGGDSSGFRVVKLGPAGIQHRYYSLAELPYRLE